MGKQLDKALALHRAGELAAAERIYAGICRRDSDNARAFYLLGVARLGLERHRDALQSLRRATQLAPRLVEAWRALAEVCDRLGQTRDAIVASERAVALAPGDIALWLNLSAYRLAVGEGADSLTATEGALALQPTHVDALINAGLALKMLGRVDEAAARFQAAMAAAPNDPRPVFNLGNMLAQRGDAAAAEPWLVRAVELAPAFAEARLTLAEVLRDRGRTNAGLAQVDAVLAMAPHHPMAHVWRCTLQLPVIYENDVDVARRRDGYAAALASLETAVAAAPARHLAGFASTRPFLLAYQGEDDRALQRRYAAILRASVTASVPEPPLEPRKGEKIRVGIVSGYFRHHSVWKIPTRGWLAELDRGAFEIVAYHTSGVTDGETDVARDFADRFVQGPKPLAEWTQLIAADACDALLYPEIGMDPMALQLAALRLAPVQCNGLGHPVTSGLSTMDYALSSDLMEPAEADAHYEETLVRLPNLSIFYEPLDVPAEVMTRAEMGVAHDAFVFWCGQSLFKYQPRHDATFAEIAARVPGVQFVFIGHQTGEAATACFVERLGRAFAARHLSVHDHLVVLPRLSTAAFAAAAGCCDAILDSIGWAGFNSTLESLAHDLPLVTFEGRFMRGRHGAAILRRLDLPEMVADTPEGFVERAVHLALDPDHLHACRAKIAAARPRLYSDASTVVALQDVLRGAVSRSRSLA